MFSFFCGLSSILHPEFMIRLEFVVKLELANPERYDRARAAMVTKISDAAPQSRPKVTTVLPF
jgi:hypothetical protein